MSKFNWNTIKLRLFNSHGVFWGYDEKKPKGFFDKYRMLDGYISILGIYLGYKMMAVYFTKVTVIEFSFLLFRHTLISFSLSYDPWHNPKTSKTPKWMYSFTFLHKFVRKSNWIDYDKYDAEEAERKAKKEAAKNAGTV